MAKNVGVVFSPIWGWFYTHDGLVMSVFLCPKSKKTVHRRRS